jgi:hypothetical protein
LRHKLTNTHTTVKAHALPPPGFLQGFHRRIEGQFR